MEEMPIDKITEKIIASVFQVSNTLGFGFVEKVYENILPKMFINHIPFISVHLR